MRLLKIYLPFFAILVLCTFGSKGADAQLVEPPTNSIIPLPSSASVPPCQLTISLLPSKNKEAIVLRAVIRNVSKKLVRYWVNKPLDNFVVEVGDAQGKRAPLTEYGEKILEPSQSRSARDTISALGLSIREGCILELTPGAQNVTELRVDELFHLERPGPYSVTAVRAVEAPDYSVRQGDPLTGSVTPPEEYSQQDFVMRSNTINIKKDAAGLFMATDIPVLRNNRDKAEIRDVVDLRLDPISEDTEHIWVVARTMLEPYKHETEVNMRTDPKTGQFILPSDIVFFPPYRGAIKVVSVLTQEPPQTNWTFSAPAGPYFTRAGYEADRIDASPFLGAATIVCRINPEAKGTDRFRPYFLLPETWASDVKPATEYFKVHPKLFEAKPSAANVAVWKGLAAAPNPWIALAAWRILAERRLLDENFARSQIAHSKEVRQAAFVVMALRQRDGSVPVALEAALRQVIGGATQTRELRGMMLGLSIYDWNSPVAERLRNAIRQKQKELDANSTDDDYINSLLTGGVYRAGVLVGAESEK